VKHLVILGGGTAGTIVANKLRPRLAGSEWDIRVIDRDDRHLYQPGLLHLPFGLVEPEQLVRSRGKQLADGVSFLTADVDRVDVEKHVVALQSGRELPYDLLVIATGTSIRPDQTPGMAGAQWRRSVFDFYTLEGALALRDRLRDWEGGRLVVHVTEMPIKCPVAPLEFAFLADDHFRRLGIRDRVEISFVTPLDAAFTKPVAAEQLGGMLQKRGITLCPDFVVERVDNEASALVSYDERVVPFDLLVTVPLNIGAEFVARSGLGDELNYVPVDHGTLQSKRAPDVFVVGDANDLPTSKAGSVAHFSADVLADNVVAYLEGKPLKDLFDGHANCFVESGRGKGLLLDFNYDTEPLPGRYPLPWIGPFSLLRESRLNHWGKVGFRWAYWHLLLPGRPMPVPRRMTRAGKHRPAAVTREKV
jgi:sulfide:quinone oxidoreductase